jgi:hypothetical protein
MKFTIVFHTVGGLDLSYGLAFLPEPAWIKGENVILKQEGKDTAYQQGFLKALMVKENIQARLGTQEKEAVVILHKSTHGNTDDLVALIEDFEEEGFRLIQSGFD